MTTTARGRVKLSEIKAVWESFTGWYWFATELHENDIAFGLVRGHETEWGYFSLQELEDLCKRGLVWQVPKSNWALCPCVVADRGKAKQPRGRQPR